MFDWSDTLTVTSTELQFLGQLNLLTCIRKDAIGCEIIDRTAVVVLLEAAKRSLYAQGRIVTPAQADQLTQETAYVLESRAVENHHSTRSDLFGCNKLSSMEASACSGNHKALIEFRTTAERTRCSIYFTSSLLLSRITKY
jgi:hypothetical protein